MAREIPRRSKRLRLALRETKLLDIPDEALSLIMEHMNSDDCSGTFQEPRHAFSLALTNTRLLAAFKGTITDISPDLSNAAPATLSSRHILAVCRLAGDNLREVRFTDCFDNTLKDLSLACPKLEVLSFHDKPRLCRNGLGTILESSRFRSLSVTYPTTALLRNLKPTPPELSLFDVEKNGSTWLESILKEPPRKFLLTIKCPPNEFLMFPAWFHMLLDVLGEAITRIETMTIRPHQDNGTFLPTGFAEEASRLFNKVRQNSVPSICRSINISGREFFPLLKSAHAEASIEVSDGRECYVGPGPRNEIYLMRIWLDSHYFPHDTARLQEVTVMESRNVPWGLWKDLLSEVKLKSAFFVDLGPAKTLALNVETIEILIPSIKRNRQWRWFGDAAEINLIGDNVLVGNQQLNLFRGITSMLRFFRGDMLWISYLAPECFTADRDDLPTRRALKSLIKAVNAFESDDGDAGTVQTMIDCVLSCWSLERRDL